MPIVVLLIMLHPVAVYPVIQEILFLPAILFQPVRIFKIYMPYIILIYFQSQFVTFSIEPESRQDPCKPSPCGPYSNCRVIDGHAVCSCQVNYMGSPPGCKPECLISAECPQNKACINQKCQDSCPGTCGLNAKCQVINHNAICSCPLGFNGDPFLNCVKQESKNKILIGSFLYIVLNYYNL